MGGDALKTVKLRAEDNGWFLLATLYGQPTRDDWELKSKNCEAWNSYMARGAIPADEIERAFSRRHKQAGSAASTVVPNFSNVEINLIDFSNVEFDEPLYLSGFSFPALINFKRAIFSAEADFANATFGGPAYFDRATFSAEANFYLATFSESARFGDATFSGDAYFGATFSKGADFSDVTFSKVANFGDVTFSRDANFERATFSDFARFDRTTFSGAANFDCATFAGHAIFKAASFSSVADFSSATFSELARTRDPERPGTLADFGDTTFSEDASFKQATFSSMVEFRRATFAEDAYFTHATFSSEVDFHGTTFGGVTHFWGVVFEAKIGFVNASMKGPASFEWAKFKGEPPRFFGAQLHEGTVWRSVTWPIPQSWDDAGEYVDAYERLKLEMDRLKRHEDELHFFALELQSRRVLDGSIPIAIYGLLCDYGRSYFLPLGWLLLTIVIGAALFLTHFGLAKYPRAIGLSLANTFGVLGFRKDFIDPNTIEALSHILKVVSAVQTVAGIVLLFCFGLAVRNRFRMK